MCRRGIRVIEIESPWHGRRTAPGAYSGEPFFARAPLGSIDLLTAQAREIAVVIDWCRRQGPGKVGIGGASLGALAAQLVATQARHWPKRLRPDMLGLITFCDRVHALPFESALARKIGLSKAMGEAGWTLEKCAAFREFTDPIGKPVVAPENIVAVLGTEDEITPYEAGRAQIERWGLPAENVFVRKSGHFSTPLGLMRDGASLDRIATILGR